MAEKDRCRVKPYELQVTEAFEHDPALARLGLKLWRLAVTDRFVPNRSTIQKTSN